MLLRFQGRSRFVTKITGPPRIGYLTSVFPDAIFVHVVRDGRAVVNSLLNVDFWIEGGGYDRPWWRNGLQEGWETEWKSFGSSPISLAALQWRTIMEVTDWERRRISSNQYFEVRYEDFLADPHRTLELVAQFCDVNATAEELRKAARSVNRARAFAYRADPELRALADLAAGRLRAYGY